MSKRGTPLGGNDQGIYEKTLADGSKRYTVRIKFTKSNGKEGNKVVTVTSLRKARQMKRQGAKKRLTGTLALDVSAITLDEMIETMIAIKQGNKRVSDNRRFLSEISDFFHPKTRINTIDEKKIAQYKKHLDQQEKTGFHKGLLSNRSKDHRLVELRHLLNTAKEKGYLTYVPKFKLYGDYGEREYSLTLSHLHDLVQVLPEAPKPHRAIVLTAWVTGMRRADLLNLKWRQYQEGRLLFGSSKTQKKGFVVSCPRQLRAEIEQLIPHRRNEFVFINPLTGSPYTDLKKSLATASRKIGLEKPVTLHMFRHLAGDEVAKVTGNEMLTQRYIGWSSPQMVRRYTHIESWTTNITDAFEARYAEVQSKAQDK